MRVIPVKKLKESWSKSAYRDSEKSLRAWYSEAKKGNWSSPHAIKRVYRTSSAIGNERIIFNICGNKYRLIVAVKYEFKIFYIRFIGTHCQYDEIDAKEI
ncbi:MAG: type II toxin-antitoxin system HigB family toxin [Candidatus Omnitrophica bacterium]|nr:type II toxin-antitoxin system HigB family toxin [Candidatus Omnitrophota bacterium]